MAIIPVMRIMFFGCRIGIVLILFVIRQDPKLPCFFCAPLFLQIAQQKYDKLRGCQE
jgi:hypothetical protein